MDGRQVGMSEDKKYVRFKRKTLKLRDVLALIRSGCYSNYDESGTDIILCPECEEWTHVRFNANSGFLDLLGDLTVENIDAEDSDIQLWIKTEKFNWFCTDRSDPDADGEGTVPSELESDCICEETER